MNTKVFRKIQKISQKFRKIHVMYTLSLKATYIHTDCQFSHNLEKCIKNVNVHIFLLFFQPDRWARVYCIILNGVLTHHINIYQYKCN